MKRNSKSKIQNSKLNSALQTPRPRSAKRGGPNSELKKSVAFLWDESFLWGLMAYKAMKANGLSFELIRSEDIKKGRLKNYAMLFVPGGWASNKLKPLGDKGINEIKKFVRNGGNYLGFCGGAGLATLEGIGLLNIKRMPTKDRVPSFSGRIYLNINEHPVWKRFKIQDAGYKIQDNHASCIMHHASENSSLVTRHSSLVFYAWWPSQFLMEDSRLKILATYGNALPDSFSSELNVGDVEMNSNWTELEEIYGINLNPKRLKNEPAVIEGTFGKGRVILSLIHFDTPDDANGAVVLKNLWNYFACQQSNPPSPPFAKGGAGGGTNSELPGLALRSGAGRTPNSELPLTNELLSSVDDLINLGIRNFLWFWRNPMLLQWRRGVKGLEYCTLYIMINEIAGVLNTKDVRYRIQDIEKHLKKIKGMLLPFVDKAKHLLVLERHEIQKNGHLTPLSPPLLRPWLVEGGWGGDYDPEIQKLRAELFSSSKSHGGLFKELIDETDKLLYALIKTEAGR